MLRKRLARGVTLYHPEAIALITDVVVEGARDGRSVAVMMQAGAHVITRDECMEGVSEMIPEGEVEANFPDGSKLVTVYNPIRYGYSLPGFAPLFALPLTSLATTAFVTPRPLPHGHGCAAGGPLT